MSCQSRARALTAESRFGTGSLEARSDDGDAALHIAVREGLTPLCAALLDGGAAHTAADGNGCVRCAVWEGVSDERTVQQHTAACGRVLGPGG
jgi:hypothetical protein